ncbi:MAG TPA: UTP--glucose-1-phosphate uridylyltransferase GalU [Candidatus Acidoferrales bacterium]|nr:UTP--glucose-1-phosphate uridylyltransferase GalU [Candidatus Acidoferrales bacterium]
MTEKPKRLRKAVLPVAGLGTRFLPATKAMPKEMLPVVDKPVIQYAVEECLAAGIEDVIFVTGRGKSAIEDHFDRSPELEALLESRGKKAQAQLVREIGGGLNFSYTRQSEALGLGHAVLCAAEIVGDEPCAVLLPDMIMHSKIPSTKSLKEIYEATGLGTILVEEVPHEKVSSYGVIAAEPGNFAQWGKQVLRIKDLVEKPSPEKAPSNLIISGRYVLPPEIFAYLRKVKPGAVGEIQLTDGLRALTKEKGMLAFIYDGKTYDAGDKLGFLIANVELGLQNPKFGADFRNYLKNLKA